MGRIQIREVSTQKRLSASGFRYHHFVNSLFLSLFVISTLPIKKILYFTYCFVDYHIMNIFHYKKHGIKISIYIIAQDFICRIIHFILLLILDSLFSLNVNKPCCYNYL